MLLHGLCCDRGTEQLVGDCGVCRLPVKMSATLVSIAAVRGGYHGGGGWGVGARVDVGTCVVDAGDPF